MKNPLTSLVIVVIWICLLSGCQAATPTATAEPTRMPEATATATPTPTPAPTFTPTPAYATNLADVQRAVIRVGAPRDAIPGLPEEGTIGYGSGVIIDPSGLALTANHAVAGELQVPVWYLSADGGFIKTTAAVLGVAECADLALLQIQTGENLPFLALREETLQNGEIIHAAGYTLTDKFILVDGTVKLPQANGNTAKTAVEFVIQHDARAVENIDGGPLVDDSGRLAGINISRDGDNQGMIALDSATVAEFLPFLKSGHLSGIGASPIPIPSWLSIINQGGILIASVMHGFLAEEIGLLPGDILVLAGEDAHAAGQRIEDLEKQAAEKSLGKSQNLSEYCRVFSDPPAQGNIIDLLALRPVRLGLQQGTVGLQLCQGQINGNAMACSPYPYVNIPFDHKKELDDWKVFVDEQNPDKHKIWLEDGRLWLNFADKNDLGGFVLMFGETSFEDVRLETSFTVSEGKYTAVQLFCRYNEGNIFDRGYYFTVSSEGEWWIEDYDSKSPPGFVLSEKVKTLPYLIYFFSGGAKSNLIKPIGEPNTIQATCIGQELSLYINGEWVYTLVDDEFHSGQVGFSLFEILKTSDYWREYGGYQMTGKNPSTTAAFEYFTISEP